MYKLNITDQANSDLERIVRYIAVELDNPYAATDFLDEVEKCYSYLKSTPMIYPKSCDSRLNKEGYRKAAIKNYLMMSTEQFNYIKTQKKNLMILMLVSQI